MPIDLKSSQPFCLKLICYFSINRFCSLDNMLKLTLNIIRMIKIDHCVQNTKIFNTLEIFGFII